MKRRTSLLAAVTFATIHYILSLVLVYVMLGQSMRDFDSSVPTSLLHRASAVLGYIVQFPIVTLASVMPIRLPRIMGEVVFIVNSAVWGLAVYAALGLLRKGGHRNAERVDH